MTEPTTTSIDSTLFDDIPDLKDPMFYGDDINATIPTVINGFSIMFQTYLDDISSFIQNVTPELRSNVVTSGMDVVRNVFLETILYTRNVLVACQITRHATSLYFEFVSQITDGQFKHVQLSVRDTVLFVYKQTIFRIHDEKKATYVSSIGELPFYKTLLAYSQLLVTTVAHFLSDDASSQELAILSSEFNVLDEQLTELLAYETIDTYAMMTSLKHISTHLIRSHADTDILFDVLTRIIAFYINRTRHNFSVNDEIKKVCENCNSAFGKRETISKTDNIEVLVRELTHIRI